MLLPERVYWNENVIISLLCLKPSRKCTLFSTEHKPRALSCTEYPSRGGSFRILLHHFSSFLNSYLFFFRCSEHLRGSPTVPREACTPALQMWPVVSAFLSCPSHVDLNTKFLLPKTEASYHLLFKANPVLSNLFLLTCLSKSLVHSTIASKLTTHFWNQYHISRNHISNLGSYTNFQRLVLCF